MKLNDHISIDLPKLIETRLLIQANSGGGKSWAIRRILEQSHGKVQQIVLDSEGEFSTLRERYEYVLIGKEGDLETSPQTATVLAHKLLETKVSAIIDLYELQPQERKRFVRLFLESMINAPKNLWHDCMVVLDEAHVFVPEKGESEASGAVIDLATRGRKRGFCAVLATQRISKLHKDAAAECNNKLIGRAAQDIDMKRAADELGFTSREQQLSLRQLEAGEFYAFGPAISNEVKKIGKIGPIHTSHPKAGDRSVNSSMPASAHIKKVISQLADIPAVAKKEAMTVAELKNEIRSLKQHRCPKVEHDPQAIDRAVKIATRKKDDEIFKERGEFIKHMNTLFKTIELIRKSCAEVLEKKDGLSIVQKPVDFTSFLPLSKMDQLGFRKLCTTVSDQDKLGKGEITILQAIAQYPEEGITNEHIAVLTGYKATSRRTYLQRLQFSGYITLSGDLYRTTDTGIEALGDNHKPLPTGQELQNYWLNNLPEGEKRVFKVILDQYPATPTFEDIETATGYKSTSRRTYLQRLSARKLIVITNGQVHASDNLFLA